VLLLQPGVFERRIQMSKCLAFLMVLVFATLAQAELYFTHTSSDYGTTWAEQSDGQFMVLRNAINDIFCSQPSSWVTPSHYEPCAGPGIEIADDFIGPSSEPWIGGVDLYVTYSTPPTSWTLRIRNDNAAAPHDPGTQRWAASPAATYFNTGYTIGGMIIWRVHFVTVSEGMVAGAHYWFTVNAMPLASGCQWISYYPAVELGRTSWGDIKTQF
jgi:hypothetical protein